VAPDSVSGDGTSLTVTITGTGFDSGTDIVFRISDRNGRLSEQVVTPDSVNTDGTELSVSVPEEAVTGPVGIVGDRNARATLLQIVPVIDNVDLRSLSGSTGATGDFRLTGFGLIEGQNTVYRFGDTEVVDRQSSSGPDSFSNNGTADVSVSISAGSFGPVTVATAGGTSAPFTVGFTGMTGEADTGTPADSMSPSANTGQEITLRRCIRGAVAQAARL